jgi:hypothetical protein
VLRFEVTIREAAQESGEKAAQRLRQCRIINRRAEFARRIVARRSSDGPFYNVVTPRFPVPVAFGGSRILFILRASATRAPIGCLNAGVEVLRSNDAR